MNMFKTAKTMRTLAEIEAGEESIFNFLDSMGILGQPMKKIFSGAAYEIMHKGQNAFVMMGLPMEYKMATKTDIICRINEYFDFLEIFKEEKIRVVDILEIIDLKHREKRRKVSTSIWYPDHRTIYFSWTDYLLVLNKIGVFENKQKKIFIREKLKKENSHIIIGDELPFEDYGKAISPKTIEKHNILGAKDENDYKEWIDQESLSKKDEWLDYKMKSLDWIPKVKNWQ